MSEQNDPTPEELEERVLTEQEEKQRQVEAQKRRDVADTLKQMGVKVDSDKIEERTERDTNPLAALSDMSQAVKIPIPGLAEALSKDENAEEEAEEEPLRRSGSGAFSEVGEHTAKKREAEKPDKDDPWTRIVPNLGTVTATQDHQEAYEEVFFSDDPLELDIPMRVGSRKVYVRCRTLSAYEREISALVVKRALDNHPLLKDATAGVLSEFIFRVDILLMVKEVDGEVWPCIHCTPEKGRAAQDDPVIDEILDVLAEQFKTLQGRKFALINKAMHRFEVILDILDDAVINGDFTDPAD